MLSKKALVSLGLASSVVLGGLGYTAYAKEPEIITNELTIAYGEELQSKLVKTSDDVVKTEFKTKLEKKLGKQSVKVEVENFIGNLSTKNIVVNVVDKEKPIIQSEGLYEVGVGSEFNVKEHVKATDNYDGDITNKVVVSEFITSELGEKKVNVSVSDTSNNVATKEIILKIVDKVKPEINIENKKITLEEKKEESPKPQPTEKKIEVSKPVEQPKEESKPVQKKEVVQKEESPKHKPMTITFNGKTLTYVNGGQSRGQQIIDTTNKISTWGGAPFNGEDGMNTHFIGHSPGNFDGIWNASTFVITDGSGKAYTYKTTKVYKVYQKNAIGVDDGVDYWDRVTGTDGGERVTFQTCAVSDKSVVWIVETVRE